MANEAIAKLDLDMWNDVMSFFPADWQECASSLNVMKGARRDKSIEDTLHTLLMYLGCGYSLKETVARAKMAERALYSSSHVALRDRLLKFGPFFRQMCSELFGEIRNQSVTGKYNFRLIDATNICENGPTGSVWRFHFSFLLPDFRCDFTKLTEIHGAGTGENLTQFSFRQGDMVLADRGYSRASGIFHAATEGAKVCIRLNYSMLKLYDINGKTLGLVNKLKGLTKSGQSAEWECILKNPDPNAQMKTLRGRICAIRLSNDKIATAHKRLRREGQLHHRKIAEETYFVHEFILLFTTFPPEEFPLDRIFLVYRWRWQVELAFKRFKSILQLGHVPTRDDETTKAWLYGKMFVALLAEKISRETDGSFSPWGNSIYAENVLQYLETLRLHSQFIKTSVDSVPRTADDNTAMGGN